MYLYDHAMITSCNGKRIHKENSENCRNNPDACHVQIDPKYRHAQAMIPHPANLAHLWAKSSNPQPASPMPLRYTQRERPR